MEKIKVIEVIADAGLGGGAQNVLGILSHLDQTRFEIFLICPKGALSKEADKINRLKVFEVEMKSKFDLVAMFQIKNIIQKIRAYRDPFGPIVVHSHGARANLLTRLILPRGIPSVYTEHSYVEGYHLKSSVNEFFQKYFLRRLNKRTNKIIAVSSPVANFLVDNDLARADQVVVIPNAVDAAQFTKAAKVKPVNAGNKSVVIGAVGNLNKQKGHEYLIEAMKLILVRYPQATCEIIGDGEQRIMLEEQIRSNKLEHHITLFGQKKDTAKYLKNWDVFVLPSTAETFGIVILEAMASGVPVVASRTGGIIDIIENKRNGLLVEPKDVDGLAAAILEIIDHPVEAAKFKRAGLQTIKRFDWSNVIKDIEKVYTEVVSA